MFVSTAGIGGGQESTVISALSTLTHHGISYVPLGYGPAFGQLSNLSEVRGGAWIIYILFFEGVCVCVLMLCVFVGSPWGAGTFAGTDGARQPTALEIELANIQGKNFYEKVAKAKL